MDTTTHSNLQQALRGEALAALKYWLFEEQAEADGFEDVADLFEQIGKEERREHGREIARLLDIPGTTRDNLGSALEGEVDEHRHLYPGFASQARQVGEIEVAERFQELGADEHRHADALRRELDRIRLDEPVGIEAAGATPSDR
jgi:rubrerythrin